MKTVGVHYYEIIVAGSDNGGEALSLQLPGPGQQISVKKLTVAASIRETVSSLGVPVNRDNKVAVSLRMPFCILPAQLQATMNNAMDFRPDISPAVLTFENYIVDINQQFELWVFNNLAVTIVANIDIWIEYDIIDTYYNAAPAKSVTSRR